MRKKAAKTAKAMVRGARANVMRVKGSMVKKGGVNTGSSQQKPNVTPRGQKPKPQPKK